MPNLYKYNFQNDFDHQCLKIVSTYSINKTTEPNQKTDSNFCITNQTASYRIVAGWNKGTYLNCALENLKGLWPVFS